MRKYKLEKGVSPFSISSSFLRLFFLSSPKSFSTLSLSHHFLPLFALPFPEWHLNGPSKIYLQCDGHPVEFQHVVAQNMYVPPLYPSPSIFPSPYFCFCFTCCSPQLPLLLFITGLLEMNIVIYWFFSFLPGWFAEWLFLDQRWGQWCLHLLSPWSISSVSTHAKQP